MLNFLNQIELVLTNRVPADYGIRLGMVKVVDHVMEFGHRGLSDCKRERTFFFFRFFMDYKSICTCVPDSFRTTTELQS